MKEWTAGPMGASRELPLDQKAERSGGAVEYRIIDSPFGALLLAGTEAGLARLSFQERDSPLRPARGWRESPGAFQDAADQLSAYFACETTDFDLRLAPTGTPFQLRVWRELMRIPYGKTASYGGIARAIGNPLAVRAVGAANAANPLPIIVPCHRVIGANGQLTGYRWGVELKRRLLELEQQGTTAGTHLARSAQR